MSEEIRTYKEKRTKREKEMRIRCKLKYLEEGNDVQECKKSSTGVESHNAALRLKV